MSLPKSKNIKGAIATMEMTVKRGRPGRKKITHSNIEKNVPIKLDLSALNIYCRYAISKNSNIKAMQLNSLQKLMNTIDPSLFANDPEKRSRVEFIKKAIDGRLGQKISDRDILLKYINGGMEKDDIIDINSLTEISTNEVNWVTTSISELIKQSYAYKYIDPMKEAMREFDAADYSKRGPIVAKIDQLAKDYVIDMRKAESLAHINDEFSLERAVFHTMIQDTWAKERDPSRKLITGMQGLNKLINGGFESGRVYLFIGLAGAGKSMFLLDVIYQIKKYNQYYVCKDKTKKPCIVLLTMENTVHETITRLFTIITSQPSMAAFTVEEVEEMMMKEGELALTDESPINIFIRFRPNLSEDTSYLDVLTDEYNDRGFETILMVQDHIKRIRPTMPMNDPRLDLGEVINEFKTYASARDIPVITVSHMNREAAAIVDEASAKNRFDTTRMLGRANVGESFLLIDNTDVGIILGKEYEEETKTSWLALSLVKCRTKHDKDLTYVALPFEKNNEIRLCEDKDMDIPLYKVSLKKEINVINESRPAKVNQVLDDDDYNVTMLPVTPASEQLPDQSAPQPQVINGIQYQATQEDIETISMMQRVGSLITGSTIVNQLSDNINQKQEPQPAIKFKDSILNDENIRTSWFNTSSNGKKIA